MIRSFLPLLLLLLTIPLSAQLVLTDENFLEPTATSVMVSYAFPESEIGLPAEGENLIWDYSDVVYGDTSLVTRFDLDPDPDFPDATFSTTGPGTALGLFPVVGTIYSVIDEASWREVGFSRGANAYSIASLTGGATDSFFVSPLSLNYSRVAVPFPTTYATTWVDEYREVAGYEISVASFNLSRAPVTVTNDILTSREVVGWGEVLMPSGPGEPVESYEALLVKRITERTDSIFLFGQPAPPQLIAAFGASQGQVIRDTSYFFYSPTEFFTAIVSFTDGMAFFRPLPQLTTSVLNLQLQPSTVFPNPAVAGNRLVFDFPPVLPGDCLLQLIGMDGRLVHEETLSPDPSDRAQITVPATLTTGPYFYVIRSPGGQPLTSGKIQLR